MGFSTSGAVVVIFAGLLIAVGIAYPAIQGAHDARSAAIDDRDQRALDMRNTAIDVHETTWDADNDTLTVRVNNTGSTSLAIDRTDLLVDGVYQTGVETSIDDRDDRQTWVPGETLEMVVELEEEPDRVQVVTQYGITDTVTGV